MEDLPAELTIDILSRLPVKTIIHCRRVCKKWRNLVLDSFFVNLHLSRSPPTTGFIIHQNVRYPCDGIMDPGILKWVEIEDKVDHHHFDLNMVPIFQNSLIFRMGSVNGLICLREHCPPQLDNTYICNPVTREILILPTPPQYYKQDVTIIAYGFGVGSLTGEYKVVRSMIRSIPLNGNKSKLVPEAEVYTLGTGQWRRLRPVPYWLDESDFGVVLNDHCHWIVSDRDAHEKICTFDLNKETFQLFPSPPSIEESDYLFESLAVLKGCLCKCDTYYSKFMIWVMKDYGIMESWHKEVVITETLSCGPGLPFLDKFSLIEGLKDGTILFMRQMGGSLYAFYPRSDRIGQMETFDQLQGWLAYRPSFLKLQNFESEKVLMF